MKTAFTKVLFSLAAGAACATAWAGPPAAAQVTLDRVASLGLMPLLVAAGTGNVSVQVPYLKVYQQDRLLWAGMPSEIQNISRSPRLPAAIKMRQLSQERAALGAPSSSSNSQALTLLVYVSEPCPPCDSLVAEAREQLTQRGLAPTDELRVRVH